MRHSLHKQFIKYIFKDDINLWEIKSDIDH